MAEKPPARGRGALLSRILGQRNTAESPATPAVGVGQSEEIPQDRPQPRGRAALLMKYVESKAQKVASVPTPTVSASTAVPTQSLESSLQTLSLSRDEPVFYKGEAGTPMRVASNYIRLDVEKDKGVFEYEVRFDPELDAKNLRVRIINQLMKAKEIGKVFDGGSRLYLPSKITDTQIVFKEPLPSDPTTSVNVTIIFKKKKSFGDSECLHLYNVLFKKIMYILLYTQMGRNYYNMNNRYLIPQHKLEVFPGFVVTVDELEGGVMLCLDSSHRVLRTQTCYELLLEIRASDPQRFKERATSAIIGSAILTRYNNATHIIDDIAWDMNPQDTFKTRDGSDISFIDYFKKQYNLDIKDINQPLLINRRTLKKSGTAEKEERFICLIPEFSFLTGLSEEQRNNFQVMKDVGMYTRVTPHQRMNALRTYLKNVNESENAQAVLKVWGLSINGVNTDTHARGLPSEMILFGGNRQIPAGNNADWNRAVTELKVTGPINLLSWLVFYTAKDERIAQSFVEKIVKLGPSLGYDIVKPKLVRLPNDRNESYMEACKQNINDRTQIAVFICPSMRNDRYSIIKKICCNQIPVPSQVINSRTLSNPKKVDSIIVKIALQMNCKMGGTLWTVKLPFKGWMVCGIDVYHSSPKETVCGLVCSINDSLTRYFSSAIFQPKELGDSYKAPFANTLSIFSNIQGSFPSKVIIFRDGVGDGQLDYVKRHEIPQFEGVLKDLGIEQLCFIVVQKRINTKIFSITERNAENPPPGTILDHTVTRKYMSDFFMVPQSVRQGTVNPTHYIVLQDTCNLKPDHVQKLCYKMCHLYYNWPGTIRVPAPCKYADRLAAQVGQHIKSTPSPSLCDKLFYL